MIEGSPAMVPAGLWHRLMAFLVDTALLASLHCTFFVVLGYGLVATADPASLAGILVVAGLLPVLFVTTPVLMVLLYSVVLHAWGGQTVGKVLMGIRLVGVDGATDVSAGVAFLRWAASLLSFLSCGAGFLWGAVSRERRAWHDHLAGTMVISVEQTS